jgi:predicted PolB exonuclease-like 3'-5' exonuclease
MPFVIDIETVPLAASLAAPYPDAERLPPANYKNEDAIARWREKDKATWQEERAKVCSLSPRLGRIVCLGYAIEDHAPHAIVAREEADEPSLLKQFWDVARDNHGALVTFNGSFDLNFLLVRSLYWRLAPSVSQATIAGWRARYKTFPHFDCRGVLTNWDNRTEGTLGDWSEFFGLGSKDGHSGADVFPLYQLGRFDEIAEYCKGDVLKTRGIYLTIAPTFAGFAA